MTSLTEARLPYDGVFPVSQPFGNRPSALNHLGYAVHWGVDVAMPDGTRVVAPDDGEIVEAEYDAGGYGYYVKLLTPDGQQWVLAHLHMWELPHPGTWVAKGATVGYSDNTGNSTGPHLHVGYRLPGAVRDLTFNGYSEPPLQFVA